MSMEIKYVLGERLAFKFSALTYHQKQRHWASGKFAVNLRLCLDFCERKGRKKEAVRGARRRKKYRKSANGCSCRALSATRIEKGFFSPSGLCEAWAHCSIEIQYWSLPTQTMMALSRLAFTVVCFLHQGASITQLGRHRQKALFFTPARVQSPLGFYSVVLH